MLIQIIGLIIVALIVLLLFFIFKKIVILILNSIIGLGALFGFNAVFGTNVHLSIWSVIITAIGGIFGFAIVIILHFLHIAF